MSGRVRRLGTFSAGPHDTARCATRSAWQSPAADRAFSGLGALQTLWGRIAWRIHIEDGGTRSGLAAGDSLDGRGGVSVRRTPVL